MEYQNWSNVTLMSVVSVYTCIFIFATGIDLLRKSICSSTQVGEGLDPFVLLTGRGMIAIHIRYDLNYPKVVDGLNCDFR